MYSHKLTMEEISSVMNHYAALEEIANVASQVPGGIVIEDDVVSIENLNGSQAIESLLEMVDQKSLNILGKDELGRAPLSQLSKEDRLRTCHAYYVSKEVAAALIRGFIPIVFNAPMQLTMLAQRYNIPIRFAFSNAVQLLDGSKCGKDVSTVIQSNKHTLDPLYNRASTFINSGASFNVCAESLIQDLEKTNHPDFLYQLANIYMKDHQYEKARVHYAKALDLYTERNAFIMNSSDFIRDYIKLCKIANSV
jgi:tetratricopeptide (TPR) repeat protein